jgi:hypothetical protein
VQFDEFLCPCGVAPGTKFAAGVFVEAVGFKMKKHLRGLDIIEEL